MLSMLNENCIMYATRFGARELIPGRATVYKYAVLYRRSIGNVEWHHGIGRRERVESAGASEIRAGSC